MQAELFGVDLSLLTSTIACLPTTPVYSPPYTVHKTSRWLHPVGSCKLVRARGHRSFGRSMYTRWLSAWVLRRWVQLGYSLMYLGSVLCASADYRSKWVYRCVRIPHHIHRPKGGITTTIKLAIRLTTRKLCYRKDDRAMRLTWSKLKIFGTPWLRPRPLFPTFSWAFVPIDRMNVPTKFEVRSFTRSWDNMGTSKIWAVPGYAHAPFSPIFLMGFYSDRPYKYTRQIWSP